jgi:hypothetical protein
MSRERRAPTSRRCHFRALSTPSGAAIQIIDTAESGMVTSVSLPKSAFTNSRSPVNSRTVAGNRSPLARMICSPRGQAGIEVFSRRRAITFNPASVKGFSPPKRTDQSSPICSSEPLTAVPSAKLRTNIGGDGSSAATEWARLLATIKVRKRDAKRAGSLSLADKAIANCKMQISNLQFAFCNLQFVTAFAPAPAVRSPAPRRTRRGA